MIVTGLLTSLPVAVVVIAVNGIAYQHMALAESLMIWLYCIIVTLILVVMLVSLGDFMRAQAPVAASTNTIASPAPTPILERVQLPQRGKLLALVVEDHYVDIVTERGKTLVLMRLTDAMKETGSVTGLQIHRSHWVASAAVVKTHRAGGKLSLELSNGMRLPVSRGFLPAVKAAGLG
ncbi:MAG: LytTR family transcriptional regulator DNA-binding domain-containing protein [Devosia sp.]